MKKIKKKDVLKRTELRKTTHKLPSIERVCKSMSAWDFVSLEIWII